MKVARTLAAALAVLSISGAARADDPAPPPASVSDKRQNPDYEGRPSAPATPGEVALWVPRIILFPIYLVTEFLIRRPLGALITAAERGNWATTLVDFFTFGPDHKAGLVPTAFFDFGFQPSVGLYFFWDDAFVKGHDIRAHGSYFGSDWVALAASDRWHTGENSRISLDAHWVRRPDYVYYGEGARTLNSARSRYLMDALDVGPAFDLAPPQGFAFHGKVGVRSVYFRDTSFFGDPSIGESVAAGTFATPASYGPGYTDAYERMQLVYDTRPPEPASQTGARVEVHGEHGNDVQTARGTSWIKYGGSLGGSVDIWNHRVLGLGVTGELADPLRGGPIPFTEEVEWGGVEPLSGFFPRRLHGRSAAAAELTYTWPIWVWLEGRLSASLGNVFDTGFKDFDPKLLRASTGIGVQSTGSADHRFEILAGFGTETIDQGAKVDSFRLVIGGTNGF